MLSLLPDQWSNLVIITSPSISHAQRVQFLDSMSSLAQSIIVLTVLLSNSTHQVRHCHYLKFTFVPAFLKKKKKKTK